ncbi:hypothetical protein AKJ64_01160 [candidate division MSBL1 archaeon SCGC-AAA259E17]|uniref:Uncharacterized protein n=1 Tax=candidate division MSBL1 archaeon SCGC-AAA259E17 TaxID=1698263 RepID=A0A133UGI0_9EURY|nr:hypothetical protein AKJ64_01160 [candidate division MSBL1 archaeon SCGC-AAA259E17]
MSRDIVQISVPRDLREKLKGVKSSEGEAYYDVIEDVPRVRSTARGLGETGAGICLVGGIEMLWSPREGRSRWISCGTNRK